MADGVAITAGSGTTILTDDTGAGGHAQVVKLAISTDGSGTLIPADGTDGLLVNLGANNDVVVSATNLDIRDLTSTDVITVTGGAGQTADVKVTLDSETVVLAAGTNNIGDVDVLSVVPGTGASNLGKAEDAAHSDGDVGVMMLGVVNNTPSANTGDYATLSIAPDGHLMVESHNRMQRTSVQSAGLTIASTAYSAGDQVGTQFTIANAARASGGYGYITGVALISAADNIGAYDVVFTDSSITLAADNAAYAISDADALKVVGVVPLSGAYDIGNNRVAQAQNLRIPYQCSGGTSLYAGLITRAGHTFFGAVGDLQLIVYMEIA